MEIDELKNYKVKKSLKTKRTPDKSGSWNPSPFKKHSFQTEQKINELFNLLNIKMN